MRNGSRAFERGEPDRDLSSLDNVITTLIAPKLKSSTYIFKFDYLSLYTIGVAPITHLRTCLIKIVTVKKDLSCFVKMGNDAEKTRVGLRFAPK